MAGEGSSSVGDPSGSMWLELLHQGLNQTAGVLHGTLSHTGGALYSTINRTGDALALSAEPYHEDLRSLGAVLGQVPYHALIFLHGLFTAANMRALPFRPYWLLCFWTSLLSGYGGGTLTNLMLQEPLLWCRDDWVLPLFAVAWWLIMYCPGDLGFRCYRLPAVKVLGRAAAGILRTRVIVSRLELAVSRFTRHAVMAPLFFGTLGGCAGKLSVDFALFFFDPAFRVPEILHPGWFLRSAFLASIWYMGCVHWLPILPKDIAFVMLVSALLAHGLLEEFLGHPVDITAPLGKMFHALTRIPEPPHRAADARTKNGEYERKRNVKNGEYKKKTM